MLKKEKSKVIFSSMLGSYFLSNRKREVKVINCGLFIILISFLNILISPVKENFIILGGLTNLLRVDSFTFNSFLNTNVSIHLD